MSSIETAPGMLTETFEHFRRCGGGRRECVAYWTGPLDHLGRVDSVAHPAHRSTAGGYEVDSSWVTSFFLSLRRDRRRARVQVHTHPGQAGHSGIDDRFALVPASGFLSLVIPNFGLGPVSLDGAYLVRMDDMGNWLPLEPSEIVAA